MHHQASSSQSWSSRFFTALVACLLLGTLPAAAQSLLLDGNASVTLNFTADAGTSPPSQTVRVTTSNSQVASFQVIAVSPVAWLLPTVTGGTTPADIPIQLNTAYLPAGTYTTSLTIRAFGYSDAVININLTIGGAGTIGVLSPSTPALTFSSNYGFNPSPQTVTISSSITTTFSVSTQVNAPFGYNWLAVSTSSNTVSPGSPAILTVTPIAGSITTGTYTGSVILTPASGAPTTIGVTFNYGTTGAVTGVLTASPSPLVLSTQPGGSTAAQLNVSHIYGSSITFFASASVSWIQLSATYGTTPQALTVTANAASLSTGTYYGTITLTPATGETQTTVQVQLNVGGGGTGLLGVYPTTLSFSAPAGGAAQQATVSIQNSVGSFTASASVTTPIGGAWLSVSPTYSATSPASLTVTANPAGLGVGTYTGTISIVSQGGISDFVYVTLNVGTTGVAGLTVTPAALAFSATIGQSPTQVLTVASPTGGAIQFTASPQASWLTVSQTNALTPATITVQANSALLTAGTYQSSIVITGGGTTVTVPVMFVLGTTPSTVSVSPLTVTLSAPTTGASVSGYAYVNSVSGASIGFSTQVSGAYWLTVSSSSTVTPATLTITANPYGLTSGTYGAFVLVQPFDGSTPQIIAVTLNVGVAGGGTSNSIFSVSPGALTFSVSQGGAPPAGQTLTITSLTGQYVIFTTAAATQSGGTWLIVEPASGFASLTYPVSVRVNPAGLSAGTYQGTVTITAQGVTASIPVTLNITGPPLTVSPSTLSFTAAAGGSAPPAQSLSVSAAGGGAVSFTASATTTTGGNWLSVSPASGSTPATLTVSVNPAGLSVGTYSGQIAVTQAGATPSTVAVTLNVVEAFTISVTANQVSLSARVGDTTAVTRAVNVSASSGARAFTVTATTSSGGNWLSVSPESGNTPADITIRANPTGLAVGTYNGTVTITAPGASNSPQTISVAFTVNPRGPVISSILHGAAMVPAYFSAGAIFSIFGENLGPQTAATLQVGPGNIVTTTLGGVRVLVNGIPAPMIYAQARQLSAVIPYGVAGLSTAEVVVEYQGERSAPRQIPLSDAAPGIFTLNATGQGAGAIINQNNTVNSAANPAPRESVIAVYVTGSGQTTPPGIDGLVPTSVLPAPLLPVTASIGGQEVDVLYAGAAPGFVSGVLQVNLRVGPNVPSGVQPIFVRIGRFSSQAGVTVAIQ